jgi:hypothetical protein
MYIANYVSFAQNTGFGLKPASSPRNDILADETD